MAAQCPVSKVEREPCNLWLAEGIGGGNDINVQDIQFLGRRGDSSGGNAVGALVEPMI